MALPEFVAHQVENTLTKYCENRIPPHVRDKIRLEYTRRGSRITLLERRPNWRDPSAKWTALPVARFEYHADKGHWTLHCADRNERWHLYESLEPTKRFEDLLEELDRDPTGIFWG